MDRKLRFVSSADETLTRLEEGGGATEVQLRNVRKALGFLQVNPLHPGLSSHEYEQFPGREDDKVWDSYVENNTPGAWRIHWMYGPDEKDESGTRVPVITVLEIGPHK